MTAIITGHGFLTGWRAEQYRRNHDVPSNGGPAPTEPEPTPVPVPEPEPAPSVQVLVIPNFEAMTREELRTEAKRLGVPGMGRMLKTDLVAAVRAAYVTAA